MKKVDYTERVTVFNKDDKAEVIEYKHEIITQTTVPKVGLMLVGWGGNNGSTLTAGLLANKHQLSWETKEGIQHSNYIGSFTQSAAIKLGYKYSSEGYLQDVYRTVNQVVPLANPQDLVLTGWDISSLDLYNSCKRAKVLEPDLLRQLKQELEQMKPMQGVYTSKYVASNQAERADNVFTGTNQQKIDKIRQDIKTFKQQVETVVVLWTANTEESVNDIQSEQELESLIANDHEVQGSLLYAIAAIEEQVVYLNGSPQNTFHSAIVSKAKAKGSYIGGADFKSGQTRYKTMMGDFLAGAGIKLRSVVSYNHLGNNDGNNLQEGHTFKSKETSKAGVLDDMIHNNQALYSTNEQIDHTVVIKYQPTVGDSKRALDEYISDIFMNGKNTIMSYNVCEDSLLAVPIMLDMVLLAEYFTRVKVDGKPLPTVFSYLSFFFKAPITNHQEYQLNSYTRQREVLCAFLKATAGYIQEDNSLIQFQF